MPSHVGVMALFSLFVSVTFGTLNTVYNVNADGTLITLFIPTGASDSKVIVVTDWGRWPVRYP